MKFIKKLIIVNILIGILFYQTITMAANNAVTNTNSSNTSNTTNTNSSNTTSSNTEKPSNANLSNLGIKPYDFTGFRYGTTTYNVEVPESVESVEVYATVQAEKAKLTGTGKMELKDGINKAEVVVTAEDGSKKTYVINITRGKTENTNTTVEATANNTNSESKGLEKLKIQDVNLEPSFKANLYEYNAKYIGEKAQLNIETVKTDDSYVVEIMGNKDLKEGENIITILVADKNGDNVATYQVIVNKALVDEEAIAKEEELKKQEQERKILVGIAAVAAIIMLIIIIIVRIKRNRRYEEEFLDIPYSGINSEKNQEEDFEEEIPRALKNNEYKNEIDENTKYIGNIDYNEEDSKNKNFSKVKEDENFEKNEKEVLREKFLNNYNSDVQFEDYEENKSRRKKNKGKRFK